MSILLKLPKALAGRRAEIFDALSVGIPGTWDVCETYMKADQPAALAQVLIQVLHAPLRDAAIAYLFKKEMKGRGRVVLGKAKKAGPIVAHLVGIDLVVEFNWTHWQLLTSEQRLALVDHELSHFTEAEDESGERVWTLTGHDVEEFSAIVHRWGLWKPDLRDFHNHLKRAQVELFPELAAVEQLLEDTH